METLNRDQGKLDGQDIVGLDAYSQDNQFVGRVTSYLPMAPDSEEGIERMRFDPTDQNGKIVGSRHVIVDGTGTIIQSILIVPVESMEVDLRGRRAVVPLTIAQIEAMPHREPNLAFENP